MHKIEIKSIPASATWKLRQEVMWPDQDLAFVKLPMDEVGVHFGLFVETRLTSVISLFVDGERAQFRKFATLEEAQGKGFGTLLLTHLIEYTKKSAVQSLWCNARLEKATFYERFGFEKTDQTFQKKGINYVIMSQDLR